MATIKDQLTTPLKAANQCGINRGVQLQAFMKGVAYARKHPDWRSVKDELPGGGEEVLVITKEGDCCIGMYNDSPFVMGWVIGHQGVPDDYIEYWMPLPQPPKED